MQGWFPPAHKFTGSSIRAQALHLRSESEEVLDALGEDDLERVAEETLDAIHCGETLLIILGKQGVDVAGVQQRVYRKNKARGYYARPCARDGATG